MLAGLIVITLLIMLMFLGRSGAGMSEDHGVSDAEYPFPDCDHDCFACQHLDDDCSGDETFQIDDFLDMEEDFEDEW